MKRSGPPARHSPMKRTGIKRGTSQLKRTPFVRSVTPPPVGGRPVAPAKSARKKREDAEFEAAKPVVIARSGGRCEAVASKDCTGRGEHVHHLAGRSKNHPDALMHVCGNCHREIHHRPERSFANGWLIRRHTEGDAA